MKSDQIIYQKESYSVAKVGEIKTYMFLKFKIFGDKMF